MSPQVVTIIASVVLILLGVVWASLGWTMRDSKRALLRGIGLILITAGLWVAGVMNLLFNGLQSLVRWFGTQTPLTVWSWVGIALFGVGLLIFVIGGFITPLTRQQRRDRDAARRAKATTRPAAPASTTTTTTL